MEDAITSGGTYNDLWPKVGHLGHNVLMMSDRECSIDL